MARQYSDLEKAEALAALAANGRNLGRTARQLKIPRNTLRHWQQGNENVPPQVAELRHQKKGELADRFEELAHRLLDGMARPEKIESATLSQLTVALGILVDKLVLLRKFEDGSVDRLSDDERASRIAAIFDRASTRKAEAMRTQPAGNGQAG